MGQMAALVEDARRMVGSKPWRWVSVPFSASFVAIAQYRVQRAGYLALGRWWQVAHTVLAPVWMLLRPFAGNVEIHYQADIGPGLRILHPALGIVVSNYAVLGERVILTGGNCIGSRPGTEAGGIIIGDHSELGANAVVLGPVTVGAKVRIAAGAVVLDDVPDGDVVGGVPARSLHAART